MAHKHILLKLNDGISDTTLEVVNEVKTLQKCLIKLKFLGANESDGKFGPKTEAAVKSFQGKHSLTPDGIVGRNTWATLAGVSPSEVEIIPRPSPSNGSGGSSLPDWHGGNKNQLAQAVAKEAHRQGVTNRNQICYIMGTIQHETGDYTPRKEIGGQNKSYAPYYGRGYVQLTHKTNYEKYSKLLNQDFVSDPDQVMEPAVSLFIIVHGMKNGAFTGKKLGDYISGSHVDFVHARQIVNVLDQADRIAGYAKEWQNTRLF